MGMFVLVTLFLFTILIILLAVEITIIGAFYCSSRVMEQVAYWSIFVLAIIGSVAIVFQVILMKG